MAKKWHSFQSGEAYPLDQILETCSKRIDSDGVEDKQGKREYLQTIRNGGQEFLKYTPTSTGWGNTPLNPRNWRTLDGQPIGSMSNAH